MDYSYLKAFMNVGLIKLKMIGEEMTEDEMEKNIKLGS